MNVTAQNIIDKLEFFLPPSLAESWDNVGLQIGDKNKSVTGVLATLDVTKESVMYAIDKGYNFILSHHPLFLKDIKSIDYDTYKGRLIHTIIEHGIVVYSAHTNLDIAVGGLNDVAAKRLGLQDVKGLERTGVKKQFKFVCFAPETHCIAVREAIKQGGGGVIGTYHGCSFTAFGEGVFTPAKGANPFLGEVGEEMAVKEGKIEAVVDEVHLDSVIRSVKGVHPYEVVPYDVYDLANPLKEDFIGRIGHLPSPMSEDEFIAHVQAAFPHGSARFGGAHCERITSVALCTGAGASLLEIAKANGAHAYITGDVRYHDMQKARELGLLVGDAGHFGTEAMAADILTDFVRKALSHECTSEVPVEAFSGQTDFFF